MVDAIETNACLHEVRAGIEGVLVLLERALGSMLQRALPA